MKKTLFLLAFYSPFSFAQMTISESTIEQFYGSNPNVVSLNERVKAAEILKGSLTRSFLPKVMLSYGHEKYTTGPYNGVNQPFGGIEGRVNVFNSGKDSLFGEQREREADLARMSSTVLKQQIKAETLKTMSQFAYLLELRGILEKALELNEINLKGAKQRIASGLATTTDTLDFQQQNISLNQQITTLDFDIKVVKKMLAVLIGQDPGSDLNLDFENSHPEHSSSLSLNLNFNNSLLVKQADLAKEISLLEQKQSSRWWAPSVDIYAFALRFLQKEREYASPGQRNDAGMGFRITMPIFDGGEALRVSQSKAAIARSNDALAKYRRFEVKRDVENAQNKLELAHNLIHGAEDNVNVMDKYRSGILSEYNRGIKNSPDVLQASQRWIESRIQFAEVKKNYQFAKADSMYLASLTPQQ